MGKSYSYSIVVEQAGSLFMNDQEVPLPEEATATGSDPLGWALDQVRSIYTQKFAEDSTSELNLSVRDRRPGGLVRRARFTDPNAGIDLSSFLQPRRGRGATVRPSPKPSAPISANQTGESETPKNSNESEEGTTEQAPPEPPKPVAEPTPPKEPQKKPLSQPASRPSRPERTLVPAGAEEPTAPTQTTTSDQAGQERAEPDSYEDRVRKERGWKKIDRSKSTRPQVGSAENEGRSRSQGLLELGKRQKTRNIVAVVVVAVLVIIGFRLFNGGTSYDAVCVDQRTMTRAVTGVACENDMDTNHRWWYVPASNELPGVGDTINQKDGGSFDEPKGTKDTINRHVENVDEDENP